MIRSAACRLPQLSGSAQAAAEASEESTRAFARHVDKLGQVYYTLAKKGRRAPDAAAAHDFFQMPDLLLDLDGDGARGVRPFGDEDAQRLTERWAVTPRRAAVSARVKQFECQVRESRRKSRQILSQPTNIWRITPHDMLSAALRGAPAEGRHDGHELTESAVSGADRTLVEKIRMENGIPAHATEDDGQLLRWMMLRRDNLEQVRQRRNEEAPSRTDMSNSLRRMKSMTGIRRLVFQCLGAGTRIGSFEKQVAIRTSLTHRIRRACERVLDQTAGDKGAAMVETLTFLGNLSERTAGLGLHVGAPLCGLGLRVSAEAGVLEATSEWLRRSHAHGLWSDLKMSGDVLCTLQSFRRLMSDGDDGGAGGPGVQTRQLVLQLLTGVDADGVATGNSLRAFVTLYLSRDCRLGARAALDMYESYVQLLGQVGAARTLWKEWRVSAPDARRRMHWDTAMDDGVAAVFGQALGHLRGAIGASDGEERADVGLDGCTTADHEAMKHQGAGGRGASDKGWELGQVRAALDLPLGEWMREVKGRGGGQVGGGQVGGGQTNGVHGSGVVAKEASQEPDV